MADARAVAQASGAVVWLAPRSSTIIAGRRPSRWRLRGTRSVVEKGGVGAELLAHHGLPEPDETFAIAANPGGHERLGQGRAQLATSGADLPRPLATLLERDSSLMDRAWR